MKTINLSQLEADALKRDQMNAVKGGGTDNPSGIEKCRSCFCPDNNFYVQSATYFDALMAELQTEPDE